MAKRNENKAAFNQYWESMAFHYDTHEIQVWGNSSANVKKKEPIFEMRYINDGDLVFSKEYLDMTELDPAFKKLVRLCLADKTNDWEKIKNVFLRA